jgi:hypothetical protein
MGILTPLFLAALAGLALPVLFHLARKTPSGHRPFSSLLFLSPTPPRLTRRSRLDQILLLLLRLSALGLLAFAFARPFLRESSILTLSDLPKRRVALLVDASASMRREDLWQQALEAVRKELEQVAPHDELALFTFGDQLRAEVPFAKALAGEDASAAGGSSALPLPAGATLELVRQKLPQLQPTWEAGDLGNALATLASELDSSGDVQQTLSEPVIIAIGDFTRSERLEALQSMAWPARVRLAVRKLSTRARTNAGIQLLTGDGDSEFANSADGEQDQGNSPRVRVSNSADSTGDQFYLSWQQEGRRLPNGASTSPDLETHRSAKKAATKDSSDDELAVQVPPGESRVVRFPRPSHQLAAERIVLRGDDHPFDNIHFVSPPIVREVTLAYLGDDAENDPQGWRYYLKLATADDPLRRVAWTTGEEAAKSLAGPLPPQLVVVTRPLATSELDLLRKVASQGAVVLLVPAHQEAFQSQQALIRQTTGDPSADGKSTGNLPEKSDNVAAAGDAAASQQPSLNAFSLVGQIEFTHPLFAPFALPRYNDFTRIHFWRRHELRREEQGGTRVLASFDDGQPWIVEQRLDKGYVFLATSGWNPDDSQWAVSTKFVPMISAWLDLATGVARPMPSVEVGEVATLPLPVVAGAILKTPQGQTRSLPAGTTEIRDTQEPGIYEVASGAAATRFAVNLASRESDTSPLELDRLEQLGVTMGGVVARSDQLERLRQARDHELEGRQQVWRWLIIACLVTLIVETWWGGRRTRSALPQVEPT